VGLVGGEAGVFEWWGALFLAGLVVVSRVISGLVMVVMVLLLLKLWRGSVWVWVCVWLTCEMLLQRKGKVFGGKRRQRRDGGREGDFPVIA
jgi:uncharacterized protein (DUF983 family)